MNRSLVVGLSVFLTIFAGGGYASAQIKPVGTFDVLSTCTSSEKPVWLTFGIVIDGWTDSKFAEAAACSVASGMTMKWVVFLARHHRMSQWRTTLPE